MLIWIDTETTGLNPRKHRLLEVAAVVTDDKLQEVARFERVIQWAPAAAILAGRTDVIESHEVDPYVVAMHTDNGLWAEVAASPHEMHTVDGELAAFIYKFSTTPDKVVRMVLGGSTPSFDRGFLEAHLPEAAKLIHYRHLDATSINEWAERYWPAVADARPRPALHDTAHRAMPDILMSIAVARYYGAALQPVPAAPNGPP